MIRLLTILQHADTAFPGGSFAFSNGLEALQAEGQVNDAAALHGIIAALLRHRWATSDRVALRGAHRQADDLSALAALDQALEAATLPQSQRRGARRNGAAFLTAHDRLATPGASELRAALRSGGLLGYLPVLQGVLWRKLGIDEAEAIMMSGYATASGLCTAAIRLGCVGALEAQRVLARCLPLLAELQTGPPPDDPKSFTPWLDIAAARQADASVRMFGS